MRKFVIVNRLLLVLAFVAYFTSRWRVGYLEVDDDENEYLNWSPILGENYVYEVRVFAPPGESALLVSSRVCAFCTLLAVMWNTYRPTKRTIIGVIIVSTLGWLLYTIATLVNKSTECVNEVGHTVNRTEGTGHRWNYTCIDSGITIETIKEDSYSGSPKYRWVTKTVLFGTSYFLAVLFSVLSIIDLRLYLTRPSETTPQKAVHVGP